MSKKRFTAEQIIGKLREAEVLQSKGENIEMICRQLGVTQQTYFLPYRDIENQLQPQRRRKHTIQSFLPFPCRCRGYRADF